MPQYNPSIDVPDLTGKIILVTGGHSGIGLATVLNLAAHNPRHIYIASRSHQKATTAIAKLSRSFPVVPVTFLPLDLSSFTSIRSCAAAFLTHESNLDILICCAGILGVPPALTEDGYEIQFGTNFLGHALLTRLLLPTLEATAAAATTTTTTDAKVQQPAGQTPTAPGRDVRIIYVSSAAAYGLPPRGGILLDKLKTDCAKISFFSPRWTCYAQSKLAQVLYAQELAQRLRVSRGPSSSNGNPVKVVCVHPGRVVEGSTISAEMPRWELVTLLDIVTKPFLRVSADEGSWNVLWAATGPAAEVVSGGFYFPVGVVPRMGEIRNEVLERRLWEWTEKELEGQVLAEGE